MPNYLGQKTKTTFLKGIEAHKLHEEFEVEGLRETLTLSAALITGNVINGNVGANAINAVTYAVSSDATLAAIAAAIAVMPGVHSATVTQISSTASDDRVIVVIPEDQVSGLSLTGFVVTAGLSQATITIATINKNVYKGMPVQLNAFGRIEPFIAGNNADYIGISIHNSTAGQLATIAVVGMGIINGQANAALTPGKVDFVGYDVVTGTNKYATASSDTTYQGWALDDATTAGDIIRVLIKS